MGYGRSYGGNIPKLNSNEWIVYILTIALSMAEKRDKFHLCNLVDEVLQLYFVSNRKNRYVILDALWLDSSFDFPYNDEFWYAPDETEKRIQNIKDTINRVQKLIPRKSAT